MTDHPNIETAARRVKELAKATYYSDRIESQLAQYAPQLADAVLAMLPVIEAAGIVEAIERGGAYARLLGSIRELRPALAAFRSAYPLGDTS